MFRNEVGDFNGCRASRRKARRVPALAATSAFCLLKGFPATNQPTISKNISNVRQPSSEEGPRSFSVEVLMDLWDNGNAKWFTVLTLQQKLDPRLFGLFRLNVSRLLGLFQTFGSVLELECCSNGSTWKYQTSVEH